MSKFQPKILINNPEKSVPDDIVEQFFLVIKSGDIDKIRDFVMKNKNKYNLFEKSGSSSRDKDFSTPAHVVLELDDKVANNSIKLRILKFLDQMGAPLDSPDATNVWPMHLAASTQSNKIVDFMIDKKVNRNVTDSSGNTPLHYAIMGREIACSIPSKPGPLVPSQKIDKEPLNKSLEDANRVLIKIIAGNDKLNNDIVHIINTIMKIPEMYAGDVLEKSLENEVISIFTDVATTPTYPSDPATGRPIITSPYASDVETGRLTTQQNKLEQLIVNTYSTIDDEWRGLTSPLQIGANKGGWGPKIPISGNIADYKFARDPNNIERIMDNELINLQTEIDNQYNTSRNKIISINTALTNTTILTIIPRIMTTIDNTYIDKLIFCPDCPNPDYGEEVGLTKMLFLLIWQYQIYNYLTDRLMDNYALMNHTLHQQIINRDPMKSRKSSYTPNQSGYLFRHEMRHLIDDGTIFNKNRFDDIFARAIPDDNNDCISDALLRLFANSDNFRTRPINLYTSELQTETINKLLDSNVYSGYASDINNFRPNFRNTDTLSWFGLLERLIQDIKPTSAPGKPAIFQDITWGHKPTGVWHRFRVVPFGMGMFTPDIAWPHGFPEPSGNTGNWRLPPTPLPKSNNLGYGDQHDTTRVFWHIGGMGNRYTYHELFRIMQMLQEFIIKGDYDAVQNPTGGVAPGDFPDIFGKKLTDWLDYVEGIGSRSVHGTTVSVSDRYPEFIFLYNILVTNTFRSIRNIIKNCIQIVYDNALNDPNIGAAGRLSPTEIIIFKNMTDGFDDSYALNLLLPSNPNPADFTKTGAQDPFGPLKNNIWSRNINLLRAFEPIINDIDVTFLNKIGNLLFKTPDAMGHGNINDLRTIIQKNVFRNQEDINNAIAMKNFRDIVRQFFGTRRKPKVNPKDPKQPKTLIDRISNRNIMLSYNNTIPVVGMMNVLDDLFTSLQNDPKKISDLFFLTETYGYFFVMIKRNLLSITKIVERINKIIADIITFIVNKTIYYVPQIFLPALIKQILIVVDHLVDIRQKLSRFNVRKAAFIPLIDLMQRKTIELGRTSNPVLNIVKLGDEFIEYINGELSKIYSNIVDAVKYHNMVIDFLNLHSAYQLERKTTGTVNRSVSGFFDMNLIQFEPFPDLLSYDDIFYLIQKNLRLYSIPEIKYYPDPNEINVLQINPFGPECPDGILGNDCKFRNYHRIIRYKRSGDKISNSPILGENRQLNITAMDDGTGKVGVLTINAVPNPISGQWLESKKIIDDVTKKADIYAMTYNNAFIAYMNNILTFEWTDGMPPSIKSLAGKHFTIIKQQIIENVIQAIIDNKTYGTSNDIPLTNVAEIRQMYENIRNLGNEETYADLPDVKIYIVIGKLIDSILNELFKYVLRQSVTSWIYSIATRNSSFRSLTSLKGSIDVIRKKDYLKLSLAELSKKAVDQLLGSNAKHIDYQLTQIEPNPRNLNYTTKPVDNKLIHYLYDINYFSQGDLKTNKKCYQIDPVIVGKMLISDTINSKNGDGNTPLHLAIYLNDPEIVELLISHGANPKSFPNLRQKTPYQIGIENAINHLQFSSGSTVIEILNNFSTTFNDLMMAQLMDDKFNRNVIKNITDGIPIALVIYNHMFHVYLENYKYDFNIELKDALQEIIRKYFNVTTNYIYPIDLFEINDTDVVKVLDPTTAQNRSNTQISWANKKKIETYEKEILMLESQLKSLETERLRTVDPKQRVFLDELKDELDKNLLKAKTAISTLNTDPNEEVDSIHKSIYLGLVKNFRENTIERTYSIINFYNYAFARIGKNNQVYLNIWNNYLNKNLHDAPSMIFPIINNIISIIINNSSAGNINAQVKKELTTISNFFSVVKNYITLKESLPQNLEENYIYREEFDHIIYLINLIVTPAMRNILLGTIYNGLQEMDGADTIFKNHDAIIEEIIKTEFNGQTIDTYLQNILPKLATKYYTTIYSNNLDPGKRLVNANELFQPIVQIIKNNRIIQVTDESLLVQNLNDYLVPFMANTYNNFIHYVRMAIYGYERYLLNTYQIVRILQSLI